MKKSYLIAGIGALTLVAVFIIYLYMGKAFEKKPWEPSKPYPYKSEDVKFENKPAKVTLAGTLTLPSESG